MGKAARLRRERPLALTFCDVDFERGSRAHGRGVAPAPPEGWVIGRAGLLHAEWDGSQLRFTGDELIDGPRPASRMINALHGKQLVVGHGILTTDLRAAVMVTDVPNSLLRRTVDTLAFAHRIRGKKYPAGCGLSALAEANLQDHRTKPAHPSSAPGLRPGGGMHGMSPARGDSDPRDDALLVARLWQTMVTTRALAWGAGSASWTHYEGNTRPGTPAGTAALAQANIDELLGRQRQIEAVEWADRVRNEGRVMRPTHLAPLAASLAQLARADLPAPQQIRELADVMREAGHIPEGCTLEAEELLTACQCLGPRQNVDVRTRILNGRKLTKALRLNVAFALWEITHPEWMAEFWRWYHLSKCTATGAIRTEQLKQEQWQIRGRIAATVAPLPGPAPGPVPGQTRSQQLKAPAKEATA
ncbi:hypothetical protein [Streptomyces anulatus]|uniref:hypothetical protein n=1 Tax=Streptomyces anulatus TaxID=1892 RepID=UPI001C27C053|nr:hypothetical protein [Streptomyces anulatus]